MPGGHRSALDRGGRREGTASHGLDLSGRQPEKKLGKQRSVFPGRRRTEKVASRKLGCGPAPRTIPCPPPSLIPKGGTRLGRGDRKARRKPPWHRRCHQGSRLPPRSALNGAHRAPAPPGEGFLRKTVHWTIFLFSCACWRYKTVGRCPFSAAASVKRWTVPTGHQRPCQLSFEKAGQRTSPAYGAHASYWFAQARRSAAAQWRDLPGVQPPRTCAGLLMSTSGASCQRRGLTAQALGVLIIKLLPPKRKPQEGIFPRRREKGAKNRARPHRTGPDFFSRFS